MKRFLFLALLSTAVFADPCGKEGSIDERIKNCNVTKDGFVLVTRDEKGIEIYKDTKSGLVWGDRIATDFNHYGSQRACQDHPEKELLKDLKWRLPTVKEFEVAASHGMKTLLPHMNHYFWTSTPVKKKSRRRRAIPAQVFLWDGMGDTTDAGDLKDGASVRCVAADRP